MLSSRKTSAPSTGVTPLLTKSLRFRSSASAYLNRTFSTPTSSLKWTWSGWVKRGQLGRLQGLIGVYPSSSPSDSNTQIFEFNASDQLQFSGFSTIWRTTNAVYRDPSSWYHIVLAYDSTQSTASNRELLYVNGVQITSFSTSNDVSLNAASPLNSNGASVYIGAEGLNSIGSGRTLDGYFTEINFIDGQALTPSSFGSTNATTGQWSPAKYTGTYGTNGFHLPFTNTTSTTTLGYDTSGNGNNWTTNNISLTAGATYDSMNDVPVAYSATAANYAVLNPLSLLVGTITNGNLSGDTGTTNGGVVYGSINIPSSGKWYWEFTQTNTGVSYSGIETIVSSTSATTPNNVWYVYDGTKIVNGTSSSYGASYGNNDTIGVAVNVDSGTITFYKNGTSQGAITYATASISVTPSWRDGSGSASISFNANFGQQPFTYTPPSGYNALNTYNLPTPTIAQGNKYMDATLYTGNTSGQTITNAGGFQPDFFWLKARSAAYDNGLIDTNRGTTYYSISNSTAAESSGSTLTGTSTGFSLVGGFNNGSTTYVAWQWQAGKGSNVSNTNGSITSTVSVSTTAGFSIVTYTGTGSSATVGHGLGSTPSMVVVKQRTSASATSWYVYHISLSSASYAVYFNSTLAQDGPTGVFWNNTAPTSSVFSIGTSTGVNVSSGTYVAYCFAPIAGFSAFGSYTGNGSTSGPFIYTGFQPKFIMTKRTNTTGDWFIWDSARNTYNSLTLALYPDLSNAEYNYGAVWNFTSNGFYPVSNSIIANNSGDTYIYMAFASNPFQYSNAF